MDNARVRRRRGDPEIGDDAVREVLARLPGLRELLRCAATCKHWRRLVIDRAFLRRLGLWPDTAPRPSILAGVFSQSCYSRDDSRDKGSLYAPPRFISLQAGLDVHDPRTFYSFVTIDGDDKGLFHLARPLAARRGFLLARVLRPCSPDNRDDDGPNKLHLAVCRPLLDRRSTHLLPPPPFNMDEYLDNNLIGCAILTAADHAAGDDDDASLDLVDHKQQQQRSMFQVLLMYKDNNDGFAYTCAYSSSSDTPGAGNWTAPVEAYPASRFTRCGPRAGLVTHGIVHWFFMHYLNHHIYDLKVTMDTSLHATLTKIPIEVHPTMPRPPIPCTVQGRLSFVTIREDGVADLWTKQEQDDIVKRKEQDDNVWQNSELTNLGRERISSVFFAESRGALLVEQHGGVLSIVDLKSKEKLPMQLKDETSERSRGTCRFLESCSSSCCRGYSHGCRGMTCLQAPPVLYEMDWVFPASTLVSPEESSLSSGQR